MGCATKLSGRILVRRWSSRRRGQCGRGSVLAQGTLANVDVRESSRTSRDIELRRRRTSGGATAACLTVIIAAAAAAAAPSALLSLEGHDYDKGRRSRERHCSNCELASGGVQ